MSLLTLLLQATSSWKRRQADLERAKRVAEENRRAAPRELAPEDWLTIDESWLQATAEDERRAEAERRRLAETMPVAEAVTDPAWVWALGGEWVHVASSNVAAIRYLLDEQILEVEFFGGGQQAFYQYYDVPPEVAVGMYRTTSPGRYVWGHLRDKFPYARISAISGAKVPKAPHVIREHLPSDR
jgi:hypothetical protein